MSGKRNETELVIEIGSLVVDGAVDARELGARLEREIADRRFGPGRDPFVAAIAARLVAALDDAGERL
ncbi:MAG TPA: hypothetical protein VMA36_06025 [Candidatus Limnocylindria bacterium]|nr:hypothetical protein [Candidatus Limnocylindria bacterium]